jgi:hypothetical protein
MWLMALEDARRLYLHVYSFSLEVKYGTPCRWYRPPLKMSADILSLCNFASTDFGIILTPIGISSSQILLQRMLS